MFPDQLNGWKEIADYLGKSVRAAQRWENELGLPVHRLKTNAGQIVFARRSEIDAWQRAVEQQRDASSRHADRSHVRRWLRFAAVGAAIVLLSALGALLVLAWRGDDVAAHDRTAVRFRFDGTSLHGIGEDGRVEWSIDFGEPVQAPDANGRQSLNPIQRADINQDGRSEALIVLSYPQAAKQEQLICVSPDGRELWRYRPSFRLRFGDQEFTGPWQISDLLVVRGGVAEGIWVALNQSVWWPGVLVRIDPHGSTSVRFVQSGNIKAIAVWPHRGRDVIVAAGVNNEHAGATIAVLDPEQAAASPQTPGSPYACREGCPGGRPLTYVVLPRSELNRISRVPYNLVVDTAVNGASMTVTTTEWQEPGIGAIYSLDSSLTPASAAMDDGYWSQHRRLEAAGVLHHDASRCPDRNRPRAFRIWSPGRGWREGIVAASQGAIPGTSDR